MQENGFLLLECKFVRHQNMKAFIAMVTHPLYGKSMRRVTTNHECIKFISHLYSADRSVSYGLLFLSVTSEITGLVCGQAGLFIQHNPDTRKFKVLYRRLEIHQKYLSSTDWEATERGEVWIRMSSFITSVIFRACSTCWGYGGPEVSGQTEKPQHK